MSSFSPFILASADDPAAPPTPAEQAPAPQRPGDGQAANGEGATVGEGQDGSPQQPAPAGGDGDAGFFGGQILIIMLVVLGAMMLFSIFAGRKEKKKRQAMLAALQKGDKVQTIGGILGTVVEIRDNEVVVKVDESSNTRMRFARQAIQNVLEGNTPQSTAK